LVLTIISCNKATFDDSDRVLARVYDEYLYFSDVKNLIQPGTSASDSLSITRNYINNWVKNQLLLQKADENLTEDQKDFSRQLEDYRNSLIIYKYESELIRQNRDTLIEDSEIEDYYNKNSQNFKLNENIVQVLYVKIEDDSPKLKKIRNFVKSDKEEDRDSLEYYCIRYADDYGLIDREWITFSDLLQKIPLTVGNPESFLPKNTFVQHHEEDYWYYIHILNFGLKNSVSPISLEKENIKSIILNKRKKLLIKKMQDEIYDQAMQENNFEFY
jgi:hypothetical protein